MTFILGLTGSIGMGKTTTAKMFAAAGVPVWDADKAVHRLYDKGGAAVDIVRLTLPDAIVDDRVSRDKLRALIAADPTVLDLLQSLVHPLVAADRQRFIDDNQTAVIVLDIPLLFESGLETLCDAVVVVTAPPEVQKHRVMARGEMTQADFDMILSRQLPDVEKRARADFIIETLSMDTTQKAVDEILTKLGFAHA